MRTERYFTLIEIIVAFAILSLIVTLTGTVLFSVQQSWSKIKENTALLEDMVKLDRIANNVFRNASVYSIFSKVTLHPIKKITVLTLISGINGEYWADSRKVTIDIKRNDFVVIFIGRIIQGNSCSLFVY